MEHHFDRYVPNYSRLSDLRTRYRRSRSRQSRHRTRSRRRDSPTNISSRRDDAFRKRRSSSPTPRNVRSSEEPIVPLVPEISSNQRPRAPSCGSNQEPPTRQKYRRHGQKSTVPHFPNQTNVMCRLGIGYTRDDYANLASRYGNVESVEMYQGFAAFIHFATHEGAKRFVSTREDVSWSQSRSYGTPHIRIKTTMPTSRGNNHTTSIVNSSANHHRENRSNGKQGNRPIVREDGVLPREYLELVKTTSGTSVALKRNPTAQESESKIKVEGGAQDIPQVPAVPATRNYEMRKSIQNHHGTREEPKKILVDKQMLEALRIENQRLNEEKMERLARENRELRQENERLKAAEQKRSGQEKVGGNEEVETGLTVSEAMKRISLKGLVCYLPPRLDAIPEENPDDVRRFEDGTFQRQQFDYTSGFDDYSSDFDDGTSGLRRSSNTQYRVPEIVDLDYTNDFDDGTSRLQRFPNTQYRMPGMVEAGRSAFEPSYDDCYNIRQAASLTTISDHGSSPKKKSCTMTVGIGVIICMVVFGCLLGKGVVKFGESVKRTLSSGAAY
ncbi:hypothetical protein K440DRAFT_661084 [Wilcoxina mikolae CBS 423.85]|nr:hypothetical protein K440DRAFT_661084 [Wilcoxina mikolae CBS 423.85]